MKIRIIFLLYLCFSIVLCVPGNSYAASMVKFDREFGGKGSGEGAFGKIINLTFDLQGNIYISDGYKKLYSIIR